MHFNRHSNLVGGHSFLSPSKYAWMNYDEEKLDRVYMASLAAQKGTELHEIAKNLIKHGLKLRGKDTLALYVNDAIGYRMTPEQVLYYSDNAFGTADAIAFRTERGQKRPILRIHDLKNGVIPGSVHQLDGYAAFFFLEYGVATRLTPFDVDMEFRIYQNDEIQIFEGDPDTIVHIMEKIKTFDKRITAMRLEAEGLL